MRPKEKGEMRSLYECQNNPSLTMRPTSDARYAEKTAELESRSKKIRQGAEQKTENAKHLVDCWIEQTLAKGVSGLQREFADLPCAVDPGLIKTFMQNSSSARNRYWDVGCLESTRVVLKATTSSDNSYIHANYIDTPFKHNRFICTQAPLPSTAYDFWQMVVQNACCVILMLCGVTENGRSKCAEYWPIKAGQSLKFDDITVKTIIVKTLKLHSECSGEIRVRVSGIAVMVNDVFTQAVDHFQWLGWSDRKVPPADLTPVSVLNHIRKSKSPIVVHCTAGIGRTGAIVAMAQILESVAEGRRLDRSIEILKHLRNQRAHLIQTDAQYVYVHRVLLEYFALKGYVSDYMADRLAAFVDDYEKTIMQP